ncbi:hypothetical protein KEM55_006890 [Ascosphaera atra]|nr:hypothetical protein KEM55_006890 [Ascosphaera atra]
MAQQILMQGQAPPLMKKKSSLRLRRKSLGETPGFYHGIKYDLIEQEPQQAAALRQDFAPPVVAPGAMPFGQAGFAPAGFEQRERGGVFRK